MIKAALKIVFAYTCLSSMYYPYRISYRAAMLKTRVFMLYCNMRMILNLP